MNRRELERPGRRATDRRQSAADNRRILLVGPDQAYRLHATYLFEEAGYVVYAASNRQQAVAFATRTLPDVVVIQLGAADALRVVTELSEIPSTYDIPVVVLSSSLQSTEAVGARAIGGVTLLTHAGDIDALIGEVDTLIATAPRAQRALKRRLLDLAELARYYALGPEGEARVRRLIDRLQVAVLAVDERGHCVAASQGATTLTGYSRVQLLTTPALEACFPDGQMSDARWRIFLVNRYYAGTTTITNRSGEDVTVHAAAVAAILPGFHLAAFVEADPRESPRSAGATCSS